MRSTVSRTLRLSEAGLDALFGVTGRLPRGVAHSWRTGPLTDVIGCATFARTKQRVIAASILQIARTSGKSIDGKTVLAAITHSGRQARVCLSGEALFVYLAVGPTSHGRFIRRAATWCLR